MIIKNILKKIKIHPLFLFVAFSSLITGLFKEFIIMFSIIVIHEIGHLIMALKYHYQIEKINLYPFGGYIKFNDYLNRPLKEEACVLLAGPLMQIIYYGIIFILYHFGCLKMTTFNMFENYHYALLVFNLLPIFPLDGSKLINILLNKVLPFKKAHLLMIYISFISLFVFSFAALDISLGVNIYLIIGLLLTKIIYETNHHNLLYNRFLLERYLHSFNFKKIKIIDNISKMMCDKKHIFLMDKKQMTEKEVLAKRFNNYK